MKPKETKQPKLITGHVMYLGPRIQHLGLGYSALFRDGINPHLYDAIAQCPAIAEMFVPVADIGRVRRELDFDYAHNMMGKTGKFVTFYKAIQSWLATKQQKKTSTIETHTYA
jgi:hypothetical protein